MGILDSKSRVMDTILTAEGRRQLAQGKLRIAHAVFTDGATFYKADVASGSADATARIYLEANSLPQDQIVFEADDSGRLVPFLGADGPSVRAGQLIEYVATTDQSGSQETMRVISGSAAMDAAETLLGASITNFQRLMLIGTHDPLFEDDGFAVGPTAVTFTVANDRPVITDTDINIDELESLFVDPRLSKLPNFKFLPPVNKVPDGSAVDLTDSRQAAQFALGNYKAWGPTADFSYDTLRSELDQIDAAGYCRVITFDPTSRTNRLVCQMFEALPTGLRKLDVIDFGTFTTHDPARPNAHVFFLGKLMRDAHNVDTFVHVFTLLFE